jgi:hypothetical protein
MTDPASMAEAEEADATGYEGQIVAIGQASFRSFDLNEDGSLDPAEFKALAKKIGLGWDDDRLSAAFTAMDLNDDGECFSEGRGGGGNKTLQCTHPCISHYV